MEGGIHRCLVRILTYENKTVVGAGFLVTDHHILTCAHVVNYAFKLDTYNTNKPQNLFYVDFPGLAKDKISVRLYKNHWYPCTKLHNPTSDIAVLELLEPPPQNSKAGLLFNPTNQQELREQRFYVNGFPIESSGEERISDGKIIGSLSYGWLDVVATDPQTGHQIQPGFSGAPAWGDKQAAIIGMVVGYDTNLQRREGFIIPTYLLLEALRDLRPLCSLKCTPKVVKRKIVEIPWYTPYLINYQSQQEQFRNLIKAHRAKGSVQRNRPLVCLLHGQEGSATANGIAYRLKIDLETYCLPKFEHYDYSVIVRDPYYFDCGDPPSKGKALHAAIRYSLKNKLKVSCLDNVQSRPFGGPVMFYAEIDGKYLSKSLLQEFFLFWQHGNWVDQNHLFLVCLFVHHPHNTWKTLWKKSRLILWLKCCAPDHCLLPELDPISKEAVRVWADSLTKQYLSERKVQKILENMNHLFPNGKHQSMETLGPKLGTYLEESST